MRVQVVMARDEREKFRRCAERAGKSLSGWLRDAARAKAEEESSEVSLRTLEALDSFFAECDARETGREPDWEEHLRVIRAGQLAGVDPDL